MVDEQDRIRLINDSARQILEPAGSASGALLGNPTPQFMFR